MADYMGFLRASRVEGEADPKAFGARHAAAKSALGHIEQLLKLSGASEDEAAQALDECRAALGEARREIGGLSDDPSEETPDDDDGDAG